MKTTIVAKLEKRKHQLVVYSWDRSLFALNLGSRYAFKLKPKIVKTLNEMSLLRFEPTKNAV